MTLSVETPVFLLGTLRDSALRKVVLGADHATQSAYLDGAQLEGVEGGDWPVLCDRAGAQAEGLVVVLPPDALARADYYEGLFGYRRVPTTVTVEGRPRTVDLWVPGAPPSPNGQAWSLSHWQKVHGPLARLAAADAMALRASHPPEATARRWPMIRARAQARLNAQSGGPTTLRRATAPGDIEIAETRVPYAAFFSVEEYDLTHARFAGGRSEPMTRAAFVSADAVTVLPYDAVRDRVLLIEQFRAGPLARGDAECWSLEAIAGRIDPGETPAQAARREAREEANLEISELIAFASYYPTPGAKSEYLYSFLAFAELPDAAAGLGGLAEEHEDIRAHVIGFAHLMSLVQSGEVDNAPLLLSALALGARRDTLRAQAVPPR